MQKATEAHAEMVGEKGKGSSEGAAAMVAVMWLASMMKQATPVPPRSHAVQPDRQTSSATAPTDPRQRKSNASETVSQSLPASVVVVPLEGAAEGAPRASLAARVEEVQGALGRRSPTDAELSEMFEHSKNDYWIWVGSDIRILVGEVASLRAALASEREARERAEADVTIACKMADDNAQLVRAATDERDAAIKEAEAALAEVERVSRLAADEIERRKAAERECAGWKADNDRRAAERAAAVLRAQAAERERDEARELLSTPCDHEEAAKEAEAALAAAERSLEEAETERGQLALALQRIGLIFRNRVGHCPACPGGATRGCDDRCWLAVVIQGRPECPGPEWNGAIAALVETPCAIPVPNPEAK